MSARGARWLVPGMAVLLVASEARTGGAQPPPASPGPSAPQTTPTRPAPDLKLLVWYDRRRPLQTFRTQVYDLRRREYTPAVDRWLATVRRDYPGYDAYVRDLSFDRLRGDTEAHKIGATIQGEFMVVGARYGYEFQPVTPTRPDSPRPRLPSPLPATPLPSWPPAQLSAPPIPFPVPMPYPRPHP